MVYKGTLLLHCVFSLYIFFYYYFFCLLFWIRERKGWRFVVQDDDANGVPSFFFFVGWLKIFCLQICGCNENDKKLFGYYSSPKLIKLFFFFPDWRISTYLRWKVVLCFSGLFFVKITKTFVQKWLPGVFCFIFFSLPHAQSIKSSHFQ